MAKVLEKEITFSTTDITVTTTTETIVGTTPQARLPVRNCRAIVRGFAHLTTGAATTTVTPRIRRGTLVTSPLVGEANAEQVKAAAGSTEQFFIEVTQDLDNVDQVEYVFTLQQAGATGNGTILQGSVSVELVG